MKGIFNIQIISSILILLIILACKESTDVKTQQSVKEIKCDNFMCHGIYYGQEFINGSDVAHQFSNKMSSAVGVKLKELYDDKKYTQVDFTNIEMTTTGMGSGKVSYMLTIPFKRVQTKCSAYTSFDHVGGWNHEPALGNRKKQLESVLMKGDSLYISDKKTTNEGLQEFWIQWRNKDKQKECAKD